MRCPKCGYISFDNQQNCGKCGRDPGAIAALLEGTVSRHLPPKFLVAALALPADDESLVVTADFDSDEIDLLTVRIASAEETAPSEESEQEKIALEENLPEDIPGESSGPVAVDKLLDLIKEEPPDELDLSPVGPGRQDLSKPTDLTDLFDLVGDQPKMASPPGRDKSEIENITDLLGDSDQQAPATDNLILEIADDDTPLGAATASESTPDIPDLGLSLESSEKREK